MEISIRNMVCPRCVRTVSRIFAAENMANARVSLGRVEVEGTMSSHTEHTIRKALIAEGFEWIDDQRVKVTEEVKRELIRLVQRGELDDMRGNLSDHLQQVMGRDYHGLSQTFSAVAGITIEQYFIQQKIEKIKEWLSYGELTLSEMSIRLGYSSVAHLSNQFKKMTGITPSSYRQQDGMLRRPIDGSSG